MRKSSKLLLIIILPIILKAQGYTVGVEVCDTVIQEFWYGGYEEGCSLSFGHNEFFDEDEYVTGLSFEIVITNVEGLVKSNNGDSIIVGDVFPLYAQIDSTDSKFIFQKHANAYFLVRVVGVPQIAGEQYFCGMWESIQTLTMCHNWFGIIPSEEGVFCKVQPLTSEVSNSQNILFNYQLEQNYPNPFNPSTTINYTIAELSFVTLKIFDVLGKEIATLVKKEQSAGNYEIEFDASKLNSGIYFYRIQAGDFSETKKMVLMK